MNINLINDDCIKAMSSIPDKSVNLILVDPPYGITSCQWDVPLDLSALWEQYNRIVTEDGNILIFGVGLFAIDVINSNRKKFRYKMIWEKNVPTGMSSARKRPMKYYEEIMLFNNGNGVYNPIKKPRVGVHKECYKYNHYCGSNNHIAMKKIEKQYDPDFVQPSDVLHFNVVPNRSGKLHPTQKPIELLEYLICTYSNEGCTVLDSCMGSGSTGVACINTNRNFIGIEIDKTYFDIAKERIDKCLSQLSSGVVAKEVKHLKF